jgi:hypothetical protein
MNEQTQRASVNRQRAKQLRTLVPGMSDEARRTALLRIAEDFDRLADTQDQRAALSP